MSKVFKSDWPRAYAFSILAHAAVVAVIVAVLAMKPDPIAGSGRLTVDLGAAYGGVTGGLGDRQEAGSLGNMGEGGDGRTRTAEKSTETENVQNAESEAPETEGEATDQPMNHVEKAEALPKTDVTGKAAPVDAVKAVADPKDSAALPVKNAVQETAKPEKVKDPKKPNVKKSHPELAKEKKPVKKTESEKIKPDAHTVADNKGRDKGKQTEAKTQGTDGESVKSATGGTGAAGSPGTVTGKELKAGSGIGSGQGIGAGDGKFLDNGDGTYTAMGSGGISYNIIRDAEPKYPKAARSIGFSKKINVTVKFLVGIDGRVEKVMVLNKKLPDLGFKEEAEKAVRKMEFEPITHDGKPLKVYFRKVIHFMP